MSRNGNPRSIHSGCLFQIVHNAAEPPRPGRNSAPTVGPLQRVAEQADHTPIPVTRPIGIDVVIACGHQSETLGQQCIDRPAPRITPPDRLAAVVIGHAETLVIAAPGDSRQNTWIGVYRLIPVKIVCQEHRHPTLVTAMFTGRFIFRQIDQHQHILPIGRRKRMRT